MTIRLSLLFEDEFGFAGESVNEVLDPSINFIEENLDYRHLDLRCKSFFL
jgi:hypothetical protein